MADGWLQVAQEALKVPGLLVEIYGDLARPGVKQVGKALETVIGLGNTVLWPIALLNERSRVALERNLDRYRKEMEAVPEDKVVSIAPEIGVPIAEKLSYVQDEKLSELYVKLLATASNSESLALAHPSFVNVINNLSPDEARLLEYFATQLNLPISYAIASNPADGSHHVLAGPLVHDDALNGLHFPGNFDAYLSNLDGLGLVKVKHDEWLTDPKHYAAVEERHKAAFTKAIESHPALTGRRLDFKKGLAQRTSFGHKFIQACHRR